MINLPENQPNVVNKGHPGLSNDISCVWVTPKTREITKKKLNRKNLFPWFSGGYNKTKQ